MEKTSDDCIRDFTKRRIDEELKSRRDELEHERYVIDSRLNIINEKIEILEQEQSEVAEAKATVQY